MTSFCPAPSPDDTLVRGLLTSVDCNLRTMSELGYHAVTGSNSQLAVALTAMLTIYIAVMGLRLMLGLAPLRIGDLTVTGLKLAVILALATSWPTYQQLVFDTLFRGPEQLAAAMMGAMQPREALLGGNPIDGLQAAYDQIQLAAAFFARVSPPSASPFTGGVAFAAFSLTLASHVMLFATLGVILISKVVLGLLLALGPVFITLLMFDSTRGIFEGWLRAAVAFALAPLFATLALVVQLVLVEPNLVALAQMRASGEVDLPAATATFMLTMVTAGVSLAGVVALFVVAGGFRLPWLSSRPPQPDAAPQSTANPSETWSQARQLSTIRRAKSIQPRVASIAAAAAALDRRDARLEASDPSRRLPSGGRRGAAEVADIRRAAGASAARRTAQPRRAASSLRRDR